VKEVKEGRNEGRKKKMKEGRKEGRNSRKELKERK
jgi:hypothetical protein